MKKLIKQLFRFGIVGVIAFIIDYSLLYILTEKFGMYYLVSSLISFGVSVIFNYIASVLWVFDVDKKKSKAKNFIYFIGLSIVGLGINELLMWIGVDKIHMYYMFVKLFATVVVMIFNFVTRKIFLE